MARHERGVKNVVPAAEKGERERQSIHSNDQKQRMWKEGNIIRSCIDSRFKGDTRGSVDKRQREFVAVNTHSSGEDESVRFFLNRMENINNN